MTPCDQSPITPDNLKRNEFARDGTSMERLLLERLLLRKELRLRSMQTRLLDQDTRIHEQQIRIQDLEKKLLDISSSPGFDTFFTFSVCWQQTVTGTNKSLSFLTNGVKFTIAVFYQALFCIFDLIPPFVSMGLAELLQRAGQMLALRAENLSNERSEKSARVLQNMRAQTQEKRNNDRRRSSRIERRRR